MNVTLSELWVHQVVVERMAAELAQQVHEVVAAFAEVHDVRRGYADVGVLRQAPEPPRAHQRE